MSQLTKPQCTTLLTILFIGALTGCSVEQSGGEPSTGVATGASGLYIDTAGLWEDVEIPVCWENDDSSNAAGRQWVREQVEKTWEFVANVDFTGWGHCGSSWVTTPGITISIEDAQPHTDWLGESWLGVEMNRALATLNFAYENWNESCQVNKEYCIRAEGAHEFGHLLGFAHEQNRDETPYPCSEEAQGSDGDEVYGSWDLNSIMNYCNPVWNGGGELSGTDIEGAQAYYGVGSRYVAAVIATISPA